MEIGGVSKVGFSRTLSKVEGCEELYFTLASTQLSERKNTNFRLLMQPFGNYRKDAFEASFLLG
jgi:hypothetical protein